MCTHSICVQVQMDACTWTSNEQEGKAGGRKDRAASSDPPADFLDRIAVGFD